MNKETEITELLHQIRQTEGEGFECDEAAILREYQKQDSEKSSLAIKVLTIFGGFLATLAFLGFLTIAGLYNSEMGMIFFGIGFIVVAIWLNKAYDKLIIDTGSISLFAAGFLLVGIGLASIEVNEDIICLLFMGMAVCVLMLAQNYILSFISVLIVTGSVLVLIFFNYEYNLIHLYVSFLALLLTFWFLKEAKIITAGKKISKLYNPVRIGLVISFLASLIFVGKEGVLELPRYIWLSSIATVACVVYVIFKLCPILHINSAKNKILVCALSFLLLLPTVMSPAISGAILIILLGFYVNFKTGFAFGIIAFIYFISQYYYDLDFTLLTKSILLFSSGILFLLLYVFTFKKLHSHEKI